MRYSVASPLFLLPTMASNSHTASVLLLSSVEVLEVPADMVVEVAAAVVVVDMI